MIWCQYPPHTVSLSLPLSPCHQSLLASLTQSVIERKETQKTYGDRKKIEARVQIKSFFVGTSHTPRSYTHTRPCPWREFLFYFMDCSRVILCSSDETFTETLETRKQTQTGKKKKK